MADFAQPLNKSTIDNVKTSARYDAGAGTWLHDSAMWAKNAGGVYVPVSHEAPLPIEVKQSSVTDPIPTKVLLRSLTAAPVHGAKTVTTVAASLFAGASRLAGRNYIAIYNESTNTIYIGGSGVTTANGFPVLPGDLYYRAIDPASDFGIYAIASANSAVRVEEGK